MQGNWVKLYLLSKNRLFSKESNIYFYLKQSQDILCRVNKYIPGNNITYLINVAGIE